MHFDRLDESYAMVKSNLNFGKVTLTGLTGLCILVRPQSCQFWSSTYAPLFFGKACVPKNTLLDQNCLKSIINDTSAIFCAKDDKIYRPCLAFLQVDDESICFGLQTFFMAIGFVALTSTSCPIVSCLRKRCNLCFWVRDKPEGHHLGCKYFESCLTSSLLQLKSPLTRSLLVTIGLCGEA